MNAPEYSGKSNKELRKLTCIKAKSEGRRSTGPGQRGNNSDCIAFLQFGTWASSWDDPAAAKQKKSNVPTVGSLPTLDEYTLPLFGPVDVPAAAPVVVEQEAVTAETPEAPKGEAPAEPAKQPLHEELTYEEFHRLIGKGRPPEVVRKEQEAAKKPLQGKRGGVLANGRDAKGVGKFENWCGQVYPSDFAYAAWRALTKTATDVANICRAKMGYEKHKLKKKDPIFHFTVAEAERTYKITRPTFSKAIKLLIEVGFIEHARRGGMPDGVGVKALYRMIEDWKTWEPPARDNTNILKARAARNILPAKGP